MSMIRIALTILLVAAPATVTFGHGFSLSLSGNTLVGSSGGANPRLFFADLAEVVGVLSSDHGAAGSSLFGSGKELGFDVFTPLFYSNGDGSPAELADPGVTLRIASQGLLGTIEVDSGAAFTAGYPISGNTSHEFRWSLLGDTIPDGVYGIGYRVRGNPVGGPAYESSDLLVTTYITPGFFPGNDPLAPDSPLSLANAAIYDAAIGVPEPSSVVMAGLGIVGLVGYGWRRRKRNVA